MTDVFADGRKQIKLLPAEQFSEFIQKKHLNVLRLFK